MIGHHYLFVDGASLHGRLRNLCKKYFNYALCDIDFTVLRADFTKVFYYDALPVRLDGESEATYNGRIKPQRDILDAAANTDRVHVYEGDARKRKNRGGMEQKKVDVQLTVDMLTHSFRKNMRQATLLTGDNDFKPLIDALIQDGMIVTLWYPSDETSNELSQAADIRRALSMQELFRLLTDDSKQIFSIPQLMNYTPSRIPLGEVLRHWSDKDRKELKLYKDPLHYTVTKQGDNLNTLHIWHPDFELLQYFCKESLDIQVPDL